jgi:seryl-tRNA synthetase
MLDIHFIRENADLVKEGARKKRVEIDIDRLLELDEERKLLRQQMDEKKAEQNRASQQITRAQGSERIEYIERMRMVKDSFTEIEEKYEKVTEEWTKLMLAVPNIPSPDTPEGPDESGNKVIRQWGEKPNFAFEPKAHWDLGKDLDVIDTEKAAEVSGARFAYLKGDLAMMQFALISHVMHTLSSAEIIKKIAEEANLDVNTKAFVPVIPPVMMRADVMGRMARLHPIDERYYFEKDELVLARCTWVKLLMNHDCLFAILDIQQRSVGKREPMERIHAAYYASINLIN